MRVVLLGGSFNPIHYGHVQILRQAMKKVHAHEGWFILANDPPLKDDQMLEFEIRKKFIDYIISGFNSLKICTIERELPTPNYSVHTISKLKSIYPQIEFYFLIGTDQAAQFDKWFEYEKILEQVKLVIYPRKGYKAIKGLNAIKLKESSLLDISSTQIRENTAFKTHPKILSEIALNGYYANERLETHLKKSRLKHSLSVADVSRDLAKAHQLDDNLAYGIGIAHDLLKQMDDELLKSYLSDDEKQQAKELWHAYGSVRYHTRKMNVKNKQFLNAIYHHTLGNSSDPYAKILYIADKCEPSRNGENNKDLLELAKRDLSKAFKIVRKRSQEYFERKKNESN